MDVSRMLDYGALGLCGMLVVTNALFVKLVVGRLFDVISTNTEAMNNLTSVLRDRPCLMEDSRVRIKT